MKKILIFVALIWATILFSDEISVFDAGNLNAENPYGLTENEKILLKNKQKVEKLNQNINTVQTDVSTVQESIDGLRSVVDGLSATNARLENRISELENKVNVNDSNLTNEISELKSIVKKNKAVQDANYKKITKALMELTSLIDSLNSAPPAHKEDQKSVINFDGKKPLNVLKEANSAYTKKDYKTAKAGFNFLIKNNYKVAYSNFMIGEIEYSSKNYSSALPYYQKSVEIYDKADYMPKLLYHTAVSFDKVGDIKNANKFYSALKKAYPDSKEAKVSPNRK